MTTLRTTSISVQNTGEAATTTATTVSYLDPCTVTVPSKVRTTRVKTYEEHAECSCGGDFKCTGHGVTQWHTKWEHRCTDCAAVAWFDRSYPCLVYKPGK